MVQFPAPGLRVSGHFDTVDCFSCHNPKSSTLTVFKFDHNANGVPRTSCLPCHEAKRPTTVINNFSHSIAGTGDCISCHKQPGVTWAGGSYNHDPKPSTCASCHESKRPTSLIGKFSHTNAGECATCHKTPGDSWKGATFNHSPAPSSCTTCHGGARPASASPPSGQSFPTPAGQPVGHYTGKDCYSCHVAYNGGTVTSFRFDHRNAVSANISFCLPCHYTDGAKKHGTTNSKYSFTGDGNCYSCHTKRRSFDN